VLLDGCRRSHHNCKTLRLSASLLAIAVTYRRAHRAGHVSLGVIAAYVKAMGGWPTFLLLASWFILAEACRVGATVWLSHWTGVADMPGAHH